MGALSPRIIEGTGTCEAQWRGSAWLSAMPLDESEDLLNDYDRLVVISPHPDDEVLGCGGLIFRARQLGLEILVVAVTDGEACYPEDPLSTPERLAATRARELAEALSELGVSEECIRALHIPDGRVASHEMELRQRLRDLIHPRDLVLVTWHADGHPDHEATGRAGIEATRDRDATACEFPVWAWHWMSADEPSPAWRGGRRYRLTGDALAAKLRSLRRFISQTDSTETHGRAPVLPAPILARFQRDYEVLLHGLD